MNGSDFLDKLEGLDPDLIQAAAQAPASKLRRVFDFSAWIAAAACLCVLFLPWILKQVFLPLAPEESAAPDNAVNTSHQLEDGGAEAGGGEAHSPQMAKEAEPEENVYEETGKLESQKADIYIECYDDSAGNSWTATILGETYQSGFPEGMLPAEEYFSHNAQAPEPVSLAVEFVDSMSFRGETEFAQSEQVKKALPDLGDSHSPLIFGDYDEKDRLSQLQMCWGLEEDDDEKGLTAWFLTATVSAQNPADPDTEVQAKIQGGETRVLRDGVTVVALGTSGQERTLSFQREGMYYRIFAQEGIPDEYMVAVLNWFLGDSFSLDLFSKENGETFHGFKAGS
ncbi:hypothetical protein D7X94_08895 [Acutalibacter sp. 1XD8-33]|uniref:hypothetical protein n=1 Tax=Acutalibacter sp. 1XD8-33 TaxID=2320081 RepID=UPI000EA1A88B|nr:hypothetical protein [Acutalibacter sp. 1XD8-33]RKJ40244.1 hypothetical protein D7X94_08895 [Acutalibacter sp. 1XD8-33]